MLYNILLFKPTASYFLQIFLCMNWCCHLHRSVITYVTERLWILNLFCEKKKKEKWFKTKKKCNFFLTVSTHLTCCLWLRPPNRLKLSHLCENKVQVRREAGVEKYLKENEEKENLDNVFVFMFFWWKVKRGQTLWSNPTFVLEIEIPKSNQNTLAYNKKWVRVI